MSASLPVLLVLLLRLACRLRAEAPPSDIVVQATSERVEIRAHRVPLHRVLDAIAASQGFPVLYDGPPPTHLVSMRLFANRMDDALRVLLSRSRAKYAMAVDPDTHRVRRLVIVVESAAVPAPQPTPLPEPPVGWQPDPVATIEEPPLADHPSPPDK